MTFLSSQHTFHPNTLPINKVLPVELIQSILKYLEPIEVSRNRQVCRYFQSCIEQISDKDMKHINLNGTSDLVLLRTSQQEVKAFPSLAVCIPAAASDLSKYIIQMLVDHPEDAVAELAVSQCKDIALLRSLSARGSERVRTGIASNQQADADFTRFWFLAQDPCSYVKAAVAANPKTPVFILKYLVEHEHEDLLVRGGLACNPETPVECLRFLMKTYGNYCIDVKLGLARNPKTPLDILGVLANDDHHLVRFNLVFKNPETWDAIRRDMSVKPGIQHEQHVEILRSLLKQEKEIGVRSALLQVLKDVAEGKNDNMKYLEVLFNVKIV